SKTRLKRSAASVIDLTSHGRKRWVRKMKQFFKEQRSLIMLQLLQFSVIGCLIWLGGFENISLILYAMFLGLFFLVLYLTYKFFTAKALYELLTKGIASFEDVQQHLGSAPL